LSVVVEEVIHHLFDSKEVFIPCGFKERDSSSLV